MKKTLKFSGFNIFIFITFCLQAQADIKPIAIVLHGGAGQIAREQMTDSTKKAYSIKMEEAITIGYAVLKEGGSSLDAVEKTIRILEDSPLFNAGKGAVYTADGTIELDASIMCGQTLKAGAVAGVSRIKNPISAARKVMTHTEHVMLIGRGAESFAHTQGIEMVDEEYFFDEKRWQQYLNKKEKGQLFPNEENEKFGTVGVVALDIKGNLAAGTSTGGMNFKKYGRVGDSPIIGAGTYADNRYAAISATGHGEFFIRNVVAYDIIALMAYKKWTLKKAAQYVINDKLKKQGAEGGIIALDKKGNIVMCFNTSAMFRAYINAKGELKTEIF